MDNLAPKYSAALQEYVAGGGEAALRRAYGLARSAIGGGQGVMDVVSMHRDAVAGVLATEAVTLSPVQALRRAGEFLTESLSVFEMTHRGFQEANETLRRLNETLEQQVADRTSALRESEELFRRFMNNSPAVAFMKDEEGRYVYVNEPFERTFDMKLDDWRGRTDVDVWPREAADQFRKNDEEVLATGRPIEVTEAVPQEDGLHRWWVFKFPVRVPSGRLFVGGMAVDVTERERAEAERDGLLQERERLARRLLAVQEEERRQVAYDIHDGPAQEIVAADMFLETYRAEKRQKEAPEVEAHLERAKGYLTTAIGETRRIISDLRPSVLDDFGLVEALRQYLAEVEGRSGCLVEFQTDMNGVRLAAGVETALFRIVQEAVTNALKHARSDKLAVRLLDHEASFVLEVEDWGSGFDPATAVASRGEGRGVGLVSMRERAELVGGSFHLESAPGEGTTVRVEVPREKAVKPEGTPEEGVMHVPANTATVEIGERNGIRVLIADDHPMVRQGLRSMLNTRGIEVIGEASDGQEAVDRVRELKPEVVLMDVRMPDMDGLTATEIVKEEAPGTSVIIVTSYESKDYLRRAIEAGAAGYLLKGMSRDSLIEAIKLVRGGGSLIDAKLLGELLQDMGVQGNRFQGAPEGALEALSPREQEVLRFLVGGLTNKEIARQMNYSVGTVKNVVQRVIEKLGVSDRTQAAVYAVRAGIAAPNI